VIPYFIKVYYPNFRSAIVVWTCLLVSSRRPQSPTINQAETGYKWEGNEAKKQMNAAHRKGGKNKLLWQRVGDVRCT
jgi:hypothetical protein